MTSSIKSRHAAAFSENSAETTPHQALAPSALNVVPNQINARDGRIDLERLGQRLEAATDQGWCLNFRALLEKPDC